MEMSEFVDMVRKHFGLLTDSYGLTIINSSGPTELGDFDVVLGTENCHISFRTDRGAFQIVVGFKSTPFSYECTDRPTEKQLMRWRSYDVWYVTRFLTNGKADWVYPWNTLPHEDWKTRLGKEMAKLSIMLEPYWKQILDFSSDEKINEKQKDLREFIEKSRKEQGVMAPLGR